MIGYLTRNLLFARIRYHKSHMKIHRMTRRRTQQRKIHVTAEENVTESYLVGVIADNVIDLLPKQEQKIKALKIGLQKALNEESKLERDRHPTYKNILQTRVWKYRLW
ncbi:uncharacterized protein LOC117182047 [Belonocnema kinseyi]|uniref:uncharacterized protein LOC117182047 n=1 Tax=Belonocnema kinseyi TaxID=2817044 RepID=UPI00143CCF4D|nr:uncharacterized protein LOC117182047 [Belonocnema kinseyi]